MYINQTKNFLLFIGLSLLKELLPSCCTSIDEDAGPIIKKVYNMHVFNIFTDYDKSNYQV